MRMNKPSPNQNRFCGVLLHPSSLPNENLCGGFGKESRDWLEILAKNGVSAWQFLPLSPTDSTGSPYSSPSSFAINPSFLDVNDLVHDGFLFPEQINQLPGNELKDKNLFENFALAELRSRIIGQQLRESWEKQSFEIHSEFKNWCKKQFWLEDHALFMQIRFDNNQLPWWEWPTEFASHDKSCLSIYKNEKQQLLLEHYLLQWHLFRQWNLLRNLARDLGVLLFGDLPFYVSRDSSDVWSNRSLFAVLSNGDIDHQSGVPPDYFSETGQLWGNPVYRWKRHHFSNFRWWIRRFARQFEQVDLLRIDHFRAFKALWKVPGNNKTAENGWWSPSPGLKLLSLLKKKYGGKLPLVAEDLGVITKDVENLRDYFNLPGMKILQFAFDGNWDNPYLPENINDYKSIVYTGTHDNPTTNGWWDDINEDIKDRVHQRFSGNQEEPSWKLIEIGMSTKSCLFIAPIQDILCLNNHARFNTPGTVGKNWSWRLNGFDEVLTTAIKNYGDLARHHGRCSADVNTLTSS